MELTIYKEEDGYLTSNSASAVPIKSIKQRIITAKKYGFKNISFIKGDLTNSKFTENLFKKNKFNVVIHLAAQPSAPLQVLV